MGVTKISVSVDEETARVIREAATAEGVSVSAWWSAAAADRIRNRVLGQALADLADETSHLDEDEVARLNAEVRARAIVTRPSEGAT